MTGLWRATPAIPSRRAARGLPHIPRDAILPSARQALDLAIVELGLSRSTYIGVPDYSSHCVLDFASRHATPVPLRFLPPREASAVLIYDQWGWQRSDDARAEVRLRFPDVPVIWDRVDSLPISFELTARHDEFDASVQVFSLSKTLGAGGGGLAWISGEGWLQIGPSPDGALAQAIAELIARATSPQERHVLDQFVRNECTARRPALEHWLATTRLEDAAADEHGERVRRLAVFSAACELPLWMKRALDGSLPAPGLVPVPTADPDRVIERGARADVELTAYHFDFSESYLQPDWRRVIALPTHSELPVETFDDLLTAATTA